MTTRVRIYNFGPGEVAVTQSGFPSHVLKPETAFEGFMHLGTDFHVAEVIKTANNPSGLPESRPTLDEPLGAPPPPRRTSTPASPQAYEPYSDTHIQIGDVLCFDTPPTFLELEMARVWADFVAGHERVTVAAMPSTSGGYAICWKAIGPFPGWRDRVTEWKTFVERFGKQPMPTPAAPANTVAPPQTNEHVAAGCESFRTPSNFQIGETVVLRGLVQGVHFEEGKVSYVVSLNPFGDGRHTYEVESDCVSAS